MNSPAPASFSLSATWEDCARMLRANAGILTAIAGVFLFLPILLLARFVPPPDQWTNLTEMFEQMQAYYERAGVWVLLVTLINMVGAIVIYLVLLAEPRLTVGAALRRALPILPFYYILTMIWGLGIGAGLVLFIVPALFLTGKLALAFPILAAEPGQGPISAVRESWRRAPTGMAFAIAVLILLVNLVVSLIGAALMVTLGSLVLLLLGPEGVGGLLRDALSSLVQAAAGVIGAVLYAAIYRATRKTVSIAKRFN